MLTPDALCTTIPWKLAFLTVKPDTTTLLMPEVLPVPSTEIPVARPVASMIVVALPAPIRASDLLIVTTSLYVPAATWTVSPAAAAVIAAAIVALQPVPEPTQKVAAGAG